MPTLTALVTVYHGNNPDHLRQALESVAAQTRPAEEILIVRDGPVPEEIAEVVSGFLERTPTARQLELPVNRGLGPASQSALDEIDTDYFARLDADDLAEPERFAVQLEFLAAHPEIDVLGTAMSEFTDDDPTTVTGVRTLPEDHAAIARYARINTPVNHPSVMLRTSAVRRAGGYRDVHFMEDYDLWARMLTNGARFHNLPEPLTRFRTGDDMFARRTGRGMFTAERRMQRNLVDYGLVGPVRAVLNLGIRTLYRALPPQLLRATYRKLFHRGG
ncbi:glycosyltransferase [Corynebacterium pygosceleis]|uniref:Glycosyltransferase n=1 Tax=Corynebacterium pygosceleis TaxID=2800406 RepID=A0A9Q4GLD8_9CORY|nr:glycosyltransferase [Corynebacterium pygosceleis]MCK7637396.1 glycosyltransferase [Corynebacterium pygosceleis]MCK7676046.1 glycosyltransferase [Corynebacterium pygosceleis]MCX7445300.1 glycosyltransferase [Corynebacterium pygosceleis]MCX7468275.1 glycosyltransferase [Corynebacterium pygosceleis]